MQEKIVKARNRKSMEHVRNSGIEQLNKYIKTLSCNEDWSVIIDQCKEKSWDKKNKLER
jgi:hypothetical protein